MAIWKRWRNLSYVFTHIQRALGEVIGWVNDWGFPVKHMKFGYKKKL